MEKCEAVAKELDEVKPSHVFVAAGSKFNELRCVFFRKSIAYAVQSSHGQAQH